MKWFTYSMLAILIAVLFLMGKISMMMMDDPNLSGSTALTAWFLASLCWLSCPVTVWILIKTY